MSLSPVQTHAESKGGSPPEYTSPWGHTGLSRDCLPCLCCEVSDILICRSTEGATTCDPTSPGIAQPATSPVTPRLECAVTSPPALHC